MGWKMGETGRHSDAAPRIGRLGFWFCLVLVVSGAMALSLFVEQNAADSGFGLGRAAWHGVVWAAALAIIWIASLRRLRDRGRSAWWIAPFVAGPAVTEATAMLLKRLDAIPAAIHVASFSSLVLTVWALIELGLMPGLARDHGRSPSSHPPRHRDSEAETMHAEDEETAKPTSPSTRPARPRATARGGGHTG
jgi:uncharacterized membrane protein YhaH (DUF805 family)